MASQTLLNIAYGSESFHIGCPYKRFEKVFLNYLHYLKSSDFLQWNNNFIVMHVPNFHLYAKSTLFLLKFFLQFYGKPFSWTGQMAL